MFRWDYFLDVKTGKEASSVFFEPHPCTAKEVDVILNKHEWLKGKLSAGLSFPAGEGRRVLYVWVPTGGNHLPKTSPKFRQLSRRRIQIKSGLDDHLLTK